jgi:hypothetical protein
MPKGGAKGGTRFPLVGIPKAIEYNARLVSKTHTGALSEDIILTGVFDSATSAGKIRASALKQYGLLEGKASAYTASQLANDIVAAPEDEKAALFAKAFFNAKVFKTLFDTFNGDTVSTAKIRQKALGEDVHPDAADKCVAFFIEGILASKLGVADADGVTIKSKGEIAAAAGPISAAGGTLEGEDENDPANEGTGANAEAETPEVDPTKKQQPVKKRQTSPPFNIDLKLDASMDPEKLEKLMQVLTRYGAI